VWFPTDRIDGQASGNGMVRRRSGKHRPSVDAITVRIRAVR
jgi:hypothetical protein